MRPQNENLRKFQVVIKINLKYFVKKKKKIELTAAERGEKFINIIINQSIDRLIN